MNRALHHPTFMGNSSGLTLFELLVVLVVMSILASAAIQRALFLDSAATRKSLDYAVSELNSRERLTWSLIKSSGGNWVNDAQVYLELNPNLGTDYSWISMAPDGGALRFKGHEIHLERKFSTSSEAGSWKIK